MLHSFTFSPFTFITVTDELPGEVKKKRERGIRGERRQLTIPCIAVPLSFTIKKGTRENVEECYSRHSS